MSLPTRPLGRGDGSRHVHFAYAKVAHGDKWHAWVAGPTMWFLCHASTRTKPCLDALTDGQLVCPKCNGPRECAVKGYVPLYRESDCAPRCVIVPESTRDTVDGLRLHWRVLVGREVEKNDGVWVVKAPHPLPLFQTTLRERMRPVDLTATLLKMWALPELTAWYLATHGKGDTAVEMPTDEPVKSDGKPFTEMTAAAARRFAPAVTPEVPTAGDAARDVLRHLQEKSGHAAGNGKPKPKG